METALENSIIGVRKALAAHGEVDLLLEARIEKLPKQKGKWLWLAWGPNTSRKTIVDLDPNLKEGAVHVLRAGNGVSTPDSEERARLILRINGYPKLAHDGSAEKSTVGGWVFTNKERQEAVTVTKWSDGDDDQIVEIPYASRHGQTQSNLDRQIFATMSVITLCMIVGLVSAFYAISGYLSQRSDTMDACTVAGRQYYQEIGSYPRLSDGRNAVQVIEQRCRRSKNAFGAVSD